MFNWPKYKFLRKWHSGDSRKIETQLIFYFLSINVSNSNSFNWDLYIKYICDPEWRRTKTLDKETKIWIKLLLRENLTRQWMSIAAMRTVTGIYWMILISKMSRRKTKSKYKLRTTLTYTMKNNWRNHRPNNLEEWRAQFISITKDLCTVSWMLPQVQREKWKMTRTMIWDKCWVRFSREISLRRNDGDFMSKLFK